MRRRLAALVAAALLAGTAACSDEPAETGAGGDRTAQSARPSEGDDRGRPAEQPSDAGTAGTPAAEQLPLAPPLVERFEPARTAAELADRLTRAEDLARDRSTTDEMQDAAAFETQLLYRQLARRPAWQAQVRGAVPPRYRADVAAHVRARQSLRSLHTTLSDELPAWEIVEPAPTADLLRFYRKGERTYGVPWEVLAAINLVETGFGKINGLSTAGAQGPMQFIPSTWAAYGEGDVNDPHDAILAAARYLAANGGDSEAGIENALYRYNNHSGYVAGIVAYASVIERDPSALRALVDWQIVYLSALGDLWLPVGYHETQPVPARRYVREFPERHLGDETS